MERRQLYSTRPKRVSRSPIITVLHHCHTQDEVFDEDDNNSVEEEIQSILFESGDSTSFVTTDDEDIVEEIPIERCSNHSLLSTFQLHTY